MFDVAEPASPKPGNGDDGLKLLEAVFNVIREEGIVPEGGGGCESIVPGVGGSASAAERYFDADPPARLRGISTRVRRCGARLPQTGQRRPEVTLGRVQPHRGQGHRPRGRRRCRRRIRQSGQEVL